jgi:hypothetical protein
MRDMKPIISTSRRGKISIANKYINFDFYINGDGEIVKRDRKLNERWDFSLHELSLSEAGQIYDPNANEMIIGCEKGDRLFLSNEATDFFEEKQCKIKLLPIHEAIDYWNRYEGHAIGLFHFPTHHN